MEQATSDAANHRLAARKNGLITSGDVASMAVQKLPGYVLITPARNEAQYIDLTLRSVTNQTVVPEKWIIVSDGSTDGTDEIVASYAAKHPWIELVRMPARKERHFAGKVDAFNAGYARAADVDHEVVGNLDADVSFKTGHFQFLLTKIAENARLGVVGAPFREGTYQYDYRFSSVENVWGGCQLFRRKCFEEIGGYMPLKGGCIDHVAVVTARMKGWQTRTFTETVCLHHREMGTAKNGGLMAKFKTGAKDYSIGNHPVWEFSRVLYQISQRPACVGALALASGYVWAFLKRAKVPVSPELVAFVRREQMDRLWRVLWRV